MPTAPSENDHGHHGEPERPGSDQPVRRARGPGQQRQRPGRGQKQQHLVRRLQRAAGGIGPEQRRVGPSHVRGEQQERHASPARGRQDPPGGHPHHEGHRHRPGSSPDTTPWGSSRRCWARGRSTARGPESRAAGRAARSTAGRDPKARPLELIRFRSITSVGIKIALLDSSNRRVNRAASLYKKQDPRRSLWRNEMSRGYDTSEDEPEGAGSRFGRVDLSFRRRGHRRASTVLRLRGGIHPIRLSADLDPNSNGHGYTKTRYSNAGEPTSEPPRPHGRGAGAPRPHHARPRRRAPLRTAAPSAPSTSGAAARCCSFRSRSWPAP